jgi:hypothetical protein
MFIIYYDLYYYLIIRWIMSSRTYDEMIKSVWPALSSMTYATHVFTGVLSKSVCLQTLSSFPRLPTILVRALPFFRHELQRGSGLICIKVSREIYLFKHFT